MSGFPEDWDYYITQRGDHLASVFVNLGLADAAPIAALPRLLAVRVPLCQPTEQGLSDLDERPVLNRIEDALRADLADLGDCLFVGRMITGGRFEFAFYLGVDVDEAGRVARTMTRFPDYDATFEIRDDPDWETYRLLLYPSPLQHRQIHDQRTLRHLQAAGDPLTQPHPVTHRVQFPNDPSRFAFVAAIGGKEPAFEIVRNEAAESADDGKRIGMVELRREESLEFSALHLVTIDLMLLAQEHGGRYLGWDAPVLRE